MTKVLLVHTKSGKKEAVEVELESLIEEIIEAVKLIAEKKFDEVKKHK